MGRRRRWARPAARRPRAGPPAGPRPAGTQRDFGVSDAFDPRQLVMMEEMVDNLETPHEPGLCQQPEPDVESLEHFGDGPPD